MVGAVLSVEELSGKLKACSVDVGAAELTVVTNANVSEGARIVVAKARQDCRCAPKRHRLSLACAWQVGAAVGDERVSKRSMGGRVSEGMLCDAPMLGWQGGGAGAAALVPGPRSHRATGRPSAGREWTASSAAAYIFLAQLRAEI